VHYPFWYVPGLTSPMLIAIVATLHVFVAMFAVGGSFVMALGTRAGYRDATGGLLRYYGRFAWFFVLITVVFGAISGVGIWWTIGLASPLATSELIHVFVFIWGLEYTVFLVEIVSAFVFLYGWNRLDRASHEAAVSVYAAAAWLSLVAITGITAFMLNTGGWQREDGLWAAFWNPQTIPQIVARTGASLLLAALFIFLHAAFALPKSDALRLRVTQQTSGWAMVGGVLVSVGGALWYAFSPPSARAALTAAASLNILMIAIFSLTLIVVVMLYFGPHRNPAWVTPGFALLFFALGFGATATGEFIREAVRKPYIIYGRVLGNQLYTWEVPEARRAGYLNSGLWTREYLRTRFPALTDAEGRVAEGKIRSLPRRERAEVGRVIFQYHCGNCHSVSGYDAVAQLTRGWPYDLTHRAVLDLNRTHFFMPPWSGTDEEAVAVTDFLTSVSRPYPPGLTEGEPEAER
jgi:cytochrome d ubiquinol oxidase subunit I